MILLLESFVKPCHPFDFVLSFNSVFRGVIRYKEKMKIVLPTLDIRLFWD